jgi:hypothetical protein
VHAPAVQSAQGDHLPAPMQQTTGHPSPPSADCTTNIPGPQPGSSPVEYEAVTKPLPAQPVPVPKDAHQEGSLAQVKGTQRRAWHRIQTFYSLLGCCWCLNSFVAAMPSSMQLTTLSCLVLTQLCRLGAITRQLAVTLRPPTPPAQPQMSCLNA